MIQQTTLFYADGGQRVAHIWPEPSGWVISWLVSPEAIMALVLREPSTAHFYDHTNQKWTGSDLVAFLDTLPFSQRRYNQIGW